MSARPRRSTLIRRPPRAIPAGLLAAALLALGAVGCWLLGTYLLQGTWPVAAARVVDAVAGMTLGSTAVRLVAVGLALVGLAWLLAALVPGRPARVRVLDDDVPGETAISRTDLARCIARRTETVDGVHSANATIRRRRIDVLVWTVVDDPRPVSRAASEAVDRTLAELRPTGQLRPRVRTGRKR